MLCMHAYVQLALQETARPVRWTFLWSGAEFHTMEWDEGATLDNKMWQAPDYCFNQPSPDPAAGTGRVQGVEVLFTSAVAVAGMAKFPTCQAWPSFSVLTCAAVLVPQQSPAYLCCAGGCVWLWCSSVQLMRVCAEDDANPNCQGQKRLRYQQSLLATCMLQHESCGSCSTSSLTMKKLVGAQGCSFALLQTA